MTDQQDTRGESVCERLGDLAVAASPDHSRAADAGQWAAIEARLGRPASGRRRRRWLVVALAATGLVGAVGLVQMRRTLVYRTLDCAVTDAHVRALDHGTVAFEDGTTVALAPGTGMRIEPLRFARGADLSLDDGEAKLAVVHRPTGRWTVAAGPFRVEVTGTRFSVRWSKTQGRFRVVMAEGEVRVSGGPVPPGTRLSAGQALDADAGHFSVERADQAPAAPEPAAEAASPAPPPVAPTTAPAPALAPEHPSVAPTKPAARPVRREGVRRASEPVSAPELQPLPSPAIRLPALPPPVAAPLTPPPPWPAVPAPPSKPTHAGPWRVTIAADGSLSNGMSGHAWLSSGTGTVFPLPVANLDHARLQPVEGKLCTQGRVVAWSCVNEGTPKIRCNWDRNWGVAVGVFVADDEAAWGPGAPSALALDFRGRSAKYRLVVHRKGDAHDKVYCIEDYRSGEVAKPSQLKTRCWEDAGETLPDFTSVDYVSLQFPAGMDYVAFRYCISAITLYP